MQTVLEKYLLDLRAIGSEYEIIAVDDGCTDGSEDVLMSYARLHRMLRVVKLNGRYGKAAAITAGFDVADPQATAIIVADVDILNPVGILQRVAEQITKHDQKIVHAHREVHGGDWFRARSSDIAVRIGCRVFGVDGHYTGKAHIAGYSRDVADVIGALPERNKYLRTVDTWEGWDIDHITYASGYNKREEQNIVEAAKRVAANTPRTKTNKSTFRDNVREHSTSLDFVFGCFVGAILALIFAIIFPFVFPAPAWAKVCVWVLFVVSTSMGLLQYSRAVLIKRVGVMHSKNFHQYKVDKIIN